MSRVTGPIVAASLAVIVTPGLALAGGMLDVLDGECRGPRVYSVPFKEQVCTRGAQGYASCRWVSRSHEVEAPERCGPRTTVEASRPADRGAFPRD